MRILAIGSVEFIDSHYVQTMLDGGFRNFEDTRAELTGANTMKIAAVEADAA